MVKKLKKRKRKMKKVKMKKKKKKKMKMNILKALISFHLILDVGVICLLRFKQCFTKLMQIVK
jgi:hypothetical protein